MSRLISLIAICLVLACASAWAAPSISGVSGTASGGEAITISGSDLGNGPSIVIFDDFEKGTNGSAIATGSSSAQVGGWTSVSGLPNASIVPQYSNLNKISGSLSMRADQTSNWATRVWKTLPPSTTKIFVSFWQLIPSGTNWPADENGVNWKTIYIGVDGVASDNHTYLHQWLNGDASGAGSMTIAGYPEAFVRYASAFSMVTGTWSRFSYYADAATTSSGILQVDELTHSGVVRRYNANNYRGLESGQSFNYISVNYFARATPNCYPTWDDVYIAVGDNARARVEIGNNATYANCTNLTICTPTSWAGSSITATVRQGSFSAGTAYLFVVDADGVVSDGYEITLGEGGEDPPAPVSANWNVSGTVRVH